MDRSGTEAPVRWARAIAAWDWGKADWKAAKVLAMIVREAQSSEAWRSRSSWTEGSTGGRVLEVKVSDSSALSSEESKKASASAASEAVGASSEVLRSSARRSTLRERWGDYDDAGALGGVVEGEAEGVAFRAEPRAAVMERRAAAEDGPGTCGDRTPGAQPRVRMQEVTEKSGLIRRVMRIC